MAVRGEVGDEADERLAGLALGGDALHLLLELDRPQRGARAKLIEQARRGGEIVVDFYPIRGWWTKKASGLLNAVKDCPAPRSARISNRPRRGVGGRVMGGG